MVANLEETWFNAQTKNEMSFYLLAVGLSMDYDNKFRKRILRKYRLDISKSSFNCLKVSKVLIVSDTT